MKIHRPILWNIIKFLPGRDLLKARQLDSFWEDMIPGILQEMERNSQSPFQPINLTDPRMLEYFMTMFPEGSPSLGMSLFQFSNLHLFPTGVPIQELERFAALHGPSLRFTTFMIHSNEHNFPKVKLLLNNSKSIEKITFQIHPFPLILQAQDYNLNPELGMLPNLESIETLPWYHTLATTPHLGNFFTDLSAKPQNSVGSLFGFP